MVLHLVYRGNKKTTSKRNGSQRKKTTKFWDSWVSVLLLFFVTCFGFVWFLMLPGTFGMIRHIICLKENQLLKSYFCRYDSYPVSQTLLWKFLVPGKEVAFGKAGKVHAHRIWNMTPRTPYDLVKSIASTPCSSKCPCSTTIESWI